MVTCKSQKIRKAAKVSKQADFWYAIAYKALQLHKYAMMRWKKYVDDRDSLLEGIEMMYEPAPDSQFSEE